MLQLGAQYVRVIPRRKYPRSVICLELFSLVLMGNTERPRYTGFRGLSVHGITALQCSMKTSLQTD